MNHQILTISDIRNIVSSIADHYQIAEVYLFGSYAREEATAESDLDFLVYGGENFKPTSIFSFAEELRVLLNKHVDVFEIREINRDSLFFRTIMKERVKVA